MHFILSVSNHLSKCRQCRRNIQQGILLLTLNKLEFAYVKFKCMSHNNFAERKEMKFGIMNTDTSCSISSALALLKALNPSLPGNLNFISILISTNTKVLKYENHLNAFILDERIQEFYDHSEGEELQPFNPFHVLKWLGKHTSILYPIKTIVLLNIF